MSEDLREPGRRRRIRVVYAVDSLIRGGTELQLVELINRLDRQTYKPYLLTIRCSDSTLAPGDCKLLQWNVPRILSAGGFMSIIRLARIFRRERIDIVHTFFQDSTVVAGTAAFLARVPVRLAALRDMAFWGTRRQRALMRATYKLMNGYVANAEVVKQHFVDLFGLPNERVIVIQNGINIDSLRFRTPEGPVRRIGVVANMTRRVKRIDVFVRAAAIVAREFPEISFDVIGEGALKPELEELARSLGVGTAVRFSGSIEDVSSYLSQIDIGVICSDSEGLSNAILEYMCKGCTVIATAVGGNLELIADGRTGLLTPPSDVTALANAMKQLVVNHELRIGLARNARAEAETRFSWPRCLALHEDLYRTRRL